MIRGSQSPSLPLKQRLNILTSQHELVGNAQEEGDGLSLQKSSMLCQLSLMDEPYAHCDRIPVCAHRI